MCDICIADIPRRRHRHGHRHPRDDPREEIACVGRQDSSRVWRVGVVVGVRVGAVECQLYSTSPHLALLGAQAKRAKIYAAHRRLD